jgi:hypothetical protein
MLNRYLGQLGEDRTVVKFLLNHYGPTSNERFDDAGTIMTTGSVKVTMPFQSGVIESVIYQQTSLYSGISNSFRLWLFQDTITSAVRGNPKAFTSSEMDSVIGTITHYADGDNPLPTPTDVWVTGFYNVPWNSILQKKVNIPYVIKSENLTLDIVQEYVGDGVTLYDRYIYCYLIIKRD